MSMGRIKLSYEKAYRLVKLLSLFVYLLGADGDSRFTRNGNYDRIGGA